MIRTCGQARSSASDQLARAGEHVFAVVNHEQLRARAEVLADRSARRAITDIDAEGGGDGAVDAACRHRAQFGHRDWHLQLGGEFAQRLGDQPCLADPADASDRDQPIAAYRAGQGRHLGVAADERRRDGEPARRLRHRPGCLGQLVAEDPALQVLQGRRGVEPELRRQDAPMPVVDLQRIGGAPGPA